MEKEMATHSSTLAWKILRTEEPSRLHSMGSHRVGHDWSELAAAASVTGSVTQSCITLCDPMNLSTPGLPVHQQLLESTQTHVYCASDIILCCAILLLPSIFPIIRVFSNESALRIKWPKYWSFSLSISPSNEHPGRISFSMNWLDLLSIQGTLRSLLQHHSSKASVLLCSAFFIVQLSHSYMTIHNQS